MWPLAIATLIGAGATAYGAYQQRQAVADTNAASASAAGTSMTFSAAEADDANRFSAQQAQVSRDFSAGQAARSMEFSHDEATRQMDFQREMSGTAYQRAVADMKAAGINPMLAVDQGGASTPSGSSGSGAMGSTSAPTGQMGSGAMPRFDVPPSAVAQFVSGASDLVRTYADLKKSLSQTTNVQADTVLKSAQTDKAIQDATKSGADAQSTRLANFQVKRQLDVEVNHPQLFGWLDSIMSRLPFFHSAISAAHLAK